MCVPDGKHLRSLCRDSVHLRLYHSANDMRAKQEARRKAQQVCMCVRERGGGEGMKEGGRK